MPRLRDHPDDLYALVSAASDAMRIPVEFVEKDFWMTELLRTVVSEAAADGAVAVFKGGTSLSKAYRIVERFSSVGTFLQGSDDLPSNRPGGFQEGLD